MSEEYRMASNNPLPIFPLTQQLLNPDVINPRVNLPPNGGFTPTAQSGGVSIGPIIHSGLGPGGLELGFGISGKF